MSTSLTINFSEQDQKDLAQFKEQISSGDIDVPDNRELRSDPMERHVVEMPSLEIPREESRRAVETALKEQKSIPKGQHVKLPDDIVEGAKAAFISSGGNISEVAALYDLTAESVLRLASQENWPVYNGSTKAIESRSKGQLKSLQSKLWHKIEIMLDAMDIETKAKSDLVQYRLHSEYVEPLASRSSAFKVLMDQYMRVSTLLEPELFGDDPDGSNYHARKVQQEKYAGGVEGVNREIADFFSQVVVGIADRISDKDRKGYGNTIIDARAE